MSKVLICLVSSVLFLSLVGDVQAVDWTDAGPDHLWSTATNWNTGVPTSGDDVNIDMLPGPTIANEGAVARQPRIGNLGTGALTVDGGTLTTTVKLHVGSGPGSIGTVNMISGSITIGTDFNVGRKGSGMLNMTGGTITTAGNLNIAEKDTGTGHVNLDGGTITANGFSMRTTLGAVGTMDIQAGTLIIDGDKESIVQRYIDNGWITAHSGNGTLSLDYNITNPGKTTLYVHNFHSLDPRPANGATVSATTNELRWTLPDPNNPAGGIVTCDVIFGTDPNILNLSVNTLTEGLTEGTLGIAVDPDQDYYWQVTVYDSDFVEPVLVSRVFTFDTRNVAPTAEAGDNIETWLVGGTRDIQLAGAAIDDDGPGPYSYWWEVTSDANDLNPATLDDAALPNATVTLPEAGEYTLSLIVDDGADPSAAADTMQITVYADSCEHAQNQDGFEALVGDTDNDCDVDLVDLSNLAVNFLEENYSIE